jgi:hypothetical protein
VVATRPRGRRGPRRAQDGAAGATRLLEAGRRLADPSTTPPGVSVELEAAAADVAVARDALSGARALPPAGPADIRDRGGWRRRDARPAALADAERPSPMPAAQPQPSRSIR